jgi:hypothetical protein
MNHQLDRLNGNLAREIQRELDLDLIGACKARGFTCVN